MIESLIAYGLTAGFLLVAIIVLALIMKGMYKLTSKEVSFVRTGMGGEKVVKDGGAFVFPVVHDMVKINMRTSKIVVQRSSADALITKDRLLVDITADFFIRVKPDAQSISAAAQTLGDRTFNIDVLKELVESKAVDALRSVTAGLNMDELHEDRQKFVQNVKATVALDLEKNGLELESVALTSFNQTDSKFFNQNNAFHAEGLAKLSATIADRRQQRNKIERDAEVAIAERDLAATQRQLELRQSQEFATLEQERKVETARAEQASNLAAQRAEQERLSKMAQIEAERATEEANIARQQAVNRANLIARRDLEIAEQERQIAVATKSSEESKARAEADRARADAIVASESVKTAEAVARAEREKQIAVLEAQQKAEQDATRIRVASQAELEAAKNRAEARATEIRVAAQADFEAADNRARAQERLTEAEAKRLDVEAEGARKINEAANLLSSVQVDAKVKLAIVENLPEIIKEMAAPMAAVDSIKIVQMGGVGGANVTANAGTNGNMPEQLTDALLKYRMNVPLVDSLTKAIGVDLNQGLNGIVDSVNAYAKFNAIDEELEPVLQKKEDPLFPTAEELRKLSGQAR